MMNLMSFLLLVLPLYLSSIPNQANYTLEAPEVVGVRAEPLSYSEVVEVPDVNKDELFVRGREWFNENFKSSKHVLQIEDKETGELAGKGTMSVIYVYKYMGERSYPADVNFTMNLWVKDGKYKYEIGNLDVNGELSVYKGPVTTSNETDAKAYLVNKKLMNQIYSSVKKETDSNVKQMIESLRQKMAQESKTSNW